MEFLTRPITAERLEKKGQSLYKSGKILIFCGLCGLGLIILSILLTGILVGFDEVEYLLTFQISDEYAFMYIIMPLSYLGFLLGLIGVPMYFNGLNIFALGKIANNTEKN